MSNGNDETIVGVEMCRDIYGKVMHGLPLGELIDIYNKAGRQLYNLSETWSKFKDERRNRKTKRPPANA